MSCLIKCSSSASSSLVTSACRTGCLVDLSPFRWCLMCPFWVSFDSGKCLLMAATVRPGQDIRNPNLAARSTADLVGNPSEACRYLTDSALLGRSVTAQMRSSSLVETFWICCFVRICVSVLTLLTSLTSGILQRPLVGSLHPFQTGSSMDLLVHHRSALRLA